MNTQKRTAIGAVILIIAFYSYIWYDIQKHRAEVLWEQYKKENSCTKEISEDMRSIWYCANDAVFVRE